MGFMNAQLYWLPFIEYLECIKHLAISLYVTFLLILTETL